MAKKESFILEYEVNCSPSVLYDLFSTPEGFREWFADKVVQKGDIFTFYWNNGSEESAQLIESELDKRAKFKWTKSQSEEEYLEFSIQKTEISNQTIFSITDFADPKEIKDQKTLWDHQVKDLFYRIGIY